MWLVLKVLCLPIRNKFIFMNLSSFHILEPDRDFQDMRLMWRTVPWTWTFRKLVIYPETKLYPGNFFFWKYKHFYNKDFLRFVFRVGDERSIFSRVANCQIKILKYLYKISVVANKNSIATALFEPWIDFQIFFKIVPYYWLKRTLNVGFADGWKDFFRDCSSMPAYFLSHWKKSYSKHNHKFIS